MKSNVYVCCLCGRTCVGYGNNPWPLNTDEDARCCDLCNSLVTTERIRMTLNRRRKEDADKRLQ